MEKNKGNSTDNGGETAAKSAGETTSSGQKRKSGVADDGTGHPSKKKTKANPSAEESEDVESGDQSDEEG